MNFESNFFVRQELDHWSCKVYESRKDLQVSFPMNSVQFRFWLLYHAPMEFPSAKQRVTRDLAAHAAQSKRKLKKLFLEEYAPPLLLIRRDVVAQSNPEAFLLDWLNLHGTREYLTLHLFFEVFDLQVTLHDARWLITDRGY